jgi:pentatricopeptide repeat protein
MDAVQLSILLKNYGKRNLPHAATKLFLERLYTRGFDVDVHAFNTILNVWSESSDHDALQQAFDLFSRLLTDSICKQRGIFPDDVSVSVMIKCISRSKSKQVGKILNGVLDLLILKNSEASEENRITLNVVLCNVAIKSCLDSGDWDTAIMILHRMKATKSLADPDVRTYNTLLSNLARKGTESASQRAKRIFFELLKASSSDSNLSLKPNLFSYNLVLKAMCSPRAVKASEEIWRIWAKMENDESVTPNNTTFKILLAFYSKTDDPIFLRRADHLLQSMLTCSTKIHQLRLNHTHFAPIIRRWILDGDTEKAKSVLLQITNLHIERKNPIKPPNPTIFFWTLQGFVGKGELIKAFELVCTVQKLMERGYLGSGFDTKARDYFIRSWEKSNHPERNVYIDKLRNSMKFINN